MTQYQFPKDLILDIQPYMIFNSYSWSMRGKKTQDIQSIKKPEDTIILPISTNGVIDSTSNNWEQGVGLGASGIKDVFVKNILSGISSSLGDLGKYITSKRGFLVNDYASLAYSGTDFRQFEFSFTLIPKNSSEANSINNLVKSFKRNSLPSYTKMKIIYPNYWTIMIKIPNHDDLIKLKNCVLTNMSVQYFNDGVPSIYMDGNPQKTEISVSFTELDRQDKKDYK